MTTFFVIYLLTCSTTPDFSQSVSKQQQTMEYITEFEATDEVQSLIDSKRHKHEIFCKATHVQIVEKNSTPMLTVTPAEDIK